MSEDRLIELETKITHQEFLIEQLNKVIYEQQTKIAEIETTLASLAKRFRNFAEQGREIGPGNERPPHY